MQRRRKGLLAGAGFAVQQDRNVSLEDFQRPLESAAQRQIAEAQARRCRRQTAILGLDDTPLRATQLAMEQLQRSRRDYSYIAQRRIHLPGEQVEHADGLRELIIPT